MAPKVRLHKGIRFALKVRVQDAFPDTLDSIVILDIRRSEVPGALFSATVLCLFDTHAQAIDWEYQGNNWTLARCKNG